MTSRDEVDAVRAAAVNAYHVLDGPPRRELVALVDLAARAAGVDHAVVNLFTSELQHSVATIGPRTALTGVPTMEIDRRDALCQVTLETGQAVLVADARDDERYAGNRYVEDGTVRFYGSMPLRTPSGVVIGTLCVFQDQARPVTQEVAESLGMLADRVVDVLELELASRRLNEANEQLTRSDERLAHFVGQVSHDLKNPLTSVSMSLEMLEMELEGQPELETMVARARRGADRMGSLISDLLSFASTGRGLEQVAVDLGQELDSAIDDLAGRLSPDDVTSGELPVVLGDPDQLRSVLMNLLDNAAKFTRDGEKPQIEVLAFGDGAHHRIEVRDRGRGVPEDQRDEVFVPLYRLDRAVEGVGIGLATCRRIIEAHHGRIGVDARAGGGSVFWFVLPAGATD